VNGVVAAADCAILAASKGDLLALLVVLGVVTVALASVGGFFLGVGNSFAGLGLLAAALLAFWSGVKANSRLRANREPHR
jgi:hypothetical protein